MMYFEIGDHAELARALDRLTGGLAAQKVPEGTVFDSKLVVNELVINVLRHGGGRAFLRVRLSEGELLVSVRGENDFRPPETSRCSPVCEECGRGLFLVDAISSRREYSKEDGITVTLKVQK